MTGEDGGGGARRAVAAIGLALALVGVATVAAAAAVVAGAFANGGRPTAVERAVVEALQGVDGAFSGARALRSPVTGTPAVLAEARRSFARRCAPCHGNDGKGTALGRAMFPPVPDLERATRDRTEGEIFHAIEHGVRFSGMPAFGTGDEAVARANWGLVAFIRRLPELLDAEREEMERLNPRPVEPAKAADPHQGHHGHGGHGQ